MQYKRRADQLNWQPHPSGAAGIDMKVLRSHRDDSTPETIVLVRIKAGSVVAPHVHPESDDNLYILSGRATMRVADETFSIGPEDQITVPINTDHEIFDVTEDLLIYDVFAPPAF